MLRSAIAQHACVVCLLLTAASAAAQPGASGGSTFSLILKADGTVWAAGQSVWGALGTPGITTSELPIQVAWLSGVTAIAAGGTHAMALTSEGRIYVWGWNAMLQLGDASTNYTETTPQL